MNRFTSTCLLIVTIATLAGCTGPGDYAKACGTTNGGVREACDKPGQSDESQDYHPR